MINFFYFLIFGRPPTDLLLLYRIKSALRIKNIRPSLIYAKRLRFIALWIAAALIFNSLAA